MMYRAQVSSWNDPPKYTQFDDLPEPNDDQVRIKVEAVGIHRVVRARASGHHYSARTLPHIPGIDGVGTTPDSTQVYFTAFGPNTSGTLSTFVNVSKDDVFPLPPGVDPVQVAALMNPAISSWLAIAVRAKPLPKDFSVLIVGATSASGKIAISIARILGAKRVIGAARNASTLSSLKLDGQIAIADDPASTDFSSLGDIDVVLDYVYGPVTEQLFSQLNSKRPTTHVQIGNLAASEIVLKGDILRSKNLTLRGSGPGSWTMQESADAIPDVLNIMPQMPQENVRTARLQDVEEVWKTQGSERLVILP